MLELCDGCQLIPRVSFSFLPKGKGGQNEIVWIIEGANTCLTDGGNKLLWVWSRSKDKVIRRPWQFCKGL